MKVPTQLRSFCAAAVLVLTAGLCAAAQPGQPQQLTAPDQVPDGLAKSEWHSIRAAYEAGRHAFQPFSVQAGGSRSVGQLSFRLPVNPPARR